MAADLGPVPAGAGTRAEVGGHDDEAEKKRARLAAGPGRRCSPRYEMPFNSGLADGAHYIIGYPSPQDKRVQITVQMRVDDVAYVC
jgi:hypothetical protein